ncbi:ShlB/FhaC/HecB family hemolysin secretion/activation protein [Fusobacterium ulcerans]|uniref:ShlB/FhaC/HecB family hemolysin secretion/activation protein n=1 Tax=Fusobacterium ulcerans TaxID=861 RepID=UPI001D09A9A6|nr:ShlB/FhaC/HecB family hemolysin secretion/activation protein [Fusobacterium ulcerans]MCB8565775.1 ShlB/FhaC/HecB family hemolysin secretion/activation protein [Fusobacterium ulcerans]MCB8650653.1 ShlB/FhaC/HecB family hemolysin secretion/activation protein [Fusobacterium ulcerans]
MKIKGIYFGIFLIFSYCVHANQQELNREERRKQAEEIRKLEKSEIKDEVKLNDIEEDIQAMGSEIRDIFIEENTILKKNQIEPLKKRYIGKKGGKSILNLMKELENLYLEEGYISVRVKIDMEKSNIPEGRIFLKVIEGHVEDIRFKDEKNQDKLKIFTSFPISRGQILNINDLDQGIDNLNSVSSNNARLDITAGEELGGSIVEIDNHKTKKISGAINYNDLGQKSTGKDRIKFSLIFDDILGINDSFASTYQRKLGNNRKYKDNENFSFYYRVPIKYWEFSISKDQSEYLSTIESFAHTYEITGVSKNINYSARRIIKRNSDGKTSVGVTLTNKETKNYFDGIKLITSSRKLSILKADISHNRRLYNGVFYGSLTYHEGIKKFGAERDENKGDYSPRAQFQKYTADLSWYKPFMIKEQRFSYRVSFSGQYSDDILYSSEKLGIGDDTTVRGFKENSIMGDKGFYLRNEIGCSYKFLEPFIAYDYGRVKDVYKDDYYEKNGSEMSGATIGVRMYLNNFDMSFSYSKPLTAPAYIKKNTHEIYFSMSARF